MEDDVASQQNAADPERAWALRLPESARAFLLQWRRRIRSTRGLSETGTLDAGVGRVLRALEKERSLFSHTQLLLLMLYEATTLLAEDLCEITRSAVEATEDGRLVVVARDPVEGPREHLLDTALSTLLRAYLARLPKRQRRLFLNHRGHALARHDIYEMVTRLKDEEEDRAFQHFFPIYHESDYAIVPTGLRLNADIHHTGKGVTIAFIDSGFFPHPDLVQPNNRVRCYVNVAEPSRDDFDDSSVDSWHGMQTSVSAAGNGYLSRGLYKGIAPDAEVVLLKVRGPRGIETQTIVEAIHWCIRHKDEHNIQIINISLSGDRPGSYFRSVVDQAAEAAVQAGIVVVVAAGNSGGDLGSEIIRPPASAPSVITVGGLNDNNQLKVESYEMYWSSYGPTLDGILKPEVVAPGIWIAAPILPGTPIYFEAGWLSRVEDAPDHEVRAVVEGALQAGVEWDPALPGKTPAEIRAVLERRKKEARLVPPYYQHVDGTSFSAPIVCSIIAQMLEANPDLTPARIKAILTSTADRLFNVPIHRQGHGLVHPRKAVKEAENDLYRTGIRRPTSPSVKGRKAVFYYKSRDARTVFIAGEFNDWDPSIHRLTFHPPDLWSIEVTFPRAGIFGYKFVVDGRWIPDPENLNREPDPYGGENSRVNIVS